MFPIIYLEEEIHDHPKVQEILSCFPDVPTVICHHYGEIFNRKNQNFRLQKSRPSLILAKKYNRFVFKTPPGYGIGKKHNYYFSHMLNCLYDCRYCFLQGMFRAAHYVFFVNFEDFQVEIAKIFEKEEATFFSGYDCDSLAFEKITGFAKTFLPFFAKYPRAECEFRTKSLQINSFLQHKPLPNTIIAYTLTPHEIQQEYEHKTPLLSQRLKALEKLQKKGWKIGLRFDPLMYCENFENIYRPFFREIFERISETNIHSVSLGVFRLPKHIHKKIFSLYPEEKLFSFHLSEKDKMFSYSTEVEKNLIDFCTYEILQYLPKQKFFPCKVKEKS